MDIEPKEGPDLLPSFQVPASVPPCLHTAALHLTTALSRGVCSYTPPHCLPNVMCHQGKMNRCRLGLCT